MKTCCTLDNEGQIVLPDGFKWFESAHEIFGLDIIDFRRTNGMFGSDQGTALKKVFDVLGGRKSAYCVAEAEDFDQAPIATSWTGWSHTGRVHQDMGPRLYNWLVWKYPGARVSFQDQPDFQVVLPDGFIINGDIGQVSVSTFLLSINRSVPGSWWLSVSDDGRRHVIITILSGPPDWIPPR